MENIDFLKSAKRLLSDSKFQQTVNYCDKRINQKPNHVDAYIIKASALKELDDLVNAEKILDGIDIESSPDNAAWGLIEYGNILHMLKKLDRSVECYQRAIELDPNNINAFYNQGLVFVEWYGKNNDEREFEKAIKCFDSVKTICNEKRMTYNNMMRFSHSTSGVKINPQLKDDVISEEPMFVNAMFQKGVALDKLGRLKEAQEEFTNVIKLEPKHKDALIGKAITYSKMNKHDDAIICLEEAIKIDPNYMVALDTMFRILDRAGRTEEALDFLNKISARIPFPYYDENKTRLEERLGFKNRNDS